MSVKEEVLTLLEANRSEDLSGQQIADLLQVSRTAVWKAFPHAAFRTAEEVAQAVQAEDYDWAALRAYRETYIETAQKDNTGDITRFLLQRIPQHLRKQREPAEV